MSRFLAIDFGPKRSGIAVTDPLKIIATPLDTLVTTDLMPFLKKYHEQEGIEAFVLGMPKKLNNEDSDNAVNVRKFAEALALQFPIIPIHFIDERFTTSIALDAMISGGMKKKDRREKGNVDKISATLILQTFMEQRR